MDIKAEEISQIIRKQVEQYDQKVTVQETGTVLTAGDGIARVYGLSGAMAGELVEFPHDVRGMVLNLEEDNVGIALLGEYQTIREGDVVKRTGRIASVPVGDAMLGRVINAIGEPIDGKGPIDSNLTRKIEVKAPGIVGRKSVHEPLQTGMKAIDAMIPIGRGQRELIIGDRGTGKTAIAVDTIINQKRPEREVHLRRHRPEAVDGGLGRRAAAAVGRAGVHRGRRGHRVGPGAAAVHRAVHRRHHRPSSSATTAATPSSSTTISPSRPWPTASCRSCSAARRAARRTRATCSTCTAGSSSAPPRCPTSAAPAR